MVSEPTDTSREAVDRLASHLELCTPHTFTKEKAAKTLRALLARAEAAEAELRDAEANINIKADWIERTINDMAATEEEFDALQAENARLREAMEYILDGYGLNAPEFKQEEKDENGEPVADDWIVSCIRAALEAKPSQTSKPHSPR